MFRPIWGQPGFTKNQIITIWIWGDQLAVTKVVIIWPGINGLLMISWLVNFDDFTHLGSTGWCELLRPFCSDRWGSGKWTAVFSVKLITISTAQISFFGNVWKRGGKDVLWIIWIIWFDLNLLIAFMTCNLYPPLWPLFFSWLLVTSFQVRENMEKIGRTFPGSLTEYMDMFSCWRLL